MPEKKLVLDGLELHYDGVFDLNGLLDAIDKYSSKRGYSKREKRRQEIITSGGKEFSMELRPTKVKAEYYFLMVKIRINITNIRDVEIKINKKKAKMQKGNVNMIFDGWAFVDFRQRWQQKPVYYFLRTVIDKFIWHFHFDKYHGELIEDVHFVRNNIKAFLDLNRYK